MAIAVKITVNCSYCASAFTLGRDPFGALENPVDAAGRLVCGDCYCTGCHAGHGLASDRNTCEWLDALNNPADEDEDDGDYERHYGDPDAARDLAIDRELCG